MDSIDVGTGRNQIAQRAWFDLILQQCECGVALPLALARKKNWQTQN